MTTRTPAIRIPCSQCPLLACEGLRPLDANQIKFMQDFKQGEMSVSKGTQVLVQGSISPHLYTVLEGILFRFKILEDGRRQIVNYVFPGDFIGVQGAMDDPLMHGVEALGEATLCVFSRDRIIELFREQPKLGYDLTWLAAKEEAALDEHLVSIGRRTARERIAYLALFLVTRGTETGIVKKNKLDISITQAQIADTLGLSIVHANRTLQSLRRSKIIEWTLNDIRVPDMEAARNFAHYDHEPGAPRPFV
jgi:CRP/FNR family transcriptional regulator, anaerobic regulatory protein